MRGIGHFIGNLQSVLPLPLVVLDQSTLELEFNHTYGTDIWRFTIQAHLGVLMAKPGYIGFQWRTSGEAVSVLDRFVSICSEPQVGSFLFKVINFACSVLIVGFVVYSVHYHICTFEGTRSRGPF